MKYYITEHGEVVSTSTFFGEYEDMFDAKAAAFDSMSDGDTLLEFPEGVDPMTEDTWGFEYADPEQATDSVTLRRTDGSIDGVPEGKWYWDDGDTADTFYNGDGTEWDGTDED